MNRDFPSQWTNDLGKTVEELSANREPETLAIMKWIEAEPFVLSGNLHGGSVVASYGFDDASNGRRADRYSSAPDDAMFRQLATVYASKHSYMSNGSSCPGDNFPGRS